MISFGAVDLLDICPLAVHLFFDLFNFFVRQQVFYIHNANAVMRVQCRKLFHGTHFQPMLQILSVMIIEGMQCQHRKSKVINPKALIGNFHGNGVMFVDFRQDLYMFLFDNIFDLMQQFPDVRFNKKAIGIRFLYSIGKCIQSNDRCPVMTHGEQCIPDKFLCHICANIQIDLFLTECTPYFITAAVRKSDIHIWCSRFPLIDQICLLLCGFSVFPELAIPDKHVLIG